MYRLVATVICVVSLSYGSSYLSACKPQRMRSCPDVPVVRNFHVKKYVGPWFAQERFPFPETDGLKCIQVTYSLNNDGGINLIYSGQSVANGSILSVYGTATPGSNPAKLVLTLAGRIGKYWVLDTDYVNYCLVWACTDTDVGPRAKAWIFTRKREGLCSKQVEQLKEKLCRYRIDTNLFIKTDQTDCEQEWYGIMEDDDISYQ